MNHVVLVGAMGAGKTTIGREVARRLGRPFFDSDDELETIHGETGAEIAAREGVDHLHSIELEIFADLAQRGTPSVIAPAASVVDSAEGRAILSGNLTIWLDAPGEVLAVRRDQDEHRRAVDLHEVRELDGRRRPSWEVLAAARVDNSSSVDEVMTTVLEEIRRIEDDQKLS